VSVVELERQIAAYLARVQISEKFKDYCIKFLHELHAKESTTQKTILETQQKAYQDCAQEIDNLVSLKTSSGNADGSQLSNEEYGRRRATLLTEKAALEELLRDAGQRIEQQLRLSEKTFDFACTAQERFAKGNARTKKKMLVTLGSNLTLKDKKLFIEAREPFFILEKSMSDEKPGNEPIEPENTGLSQGQKSAYLSVYPNVLGGLDDVRTLRHRNEHLVKSVYHFFQSVCMSPSFTLSDWFYLYHSGSMDDWKN
jgi:hypothetical protein